MAARRRASSARAGAPSVDSRSPSRSRPQSRGESSNPPPVALAKVHVPPQGARPSDEDSDSEGGGGGPPAGWAGAVTCGVLALVLVRYCVGVWPHSGMGTPPMFGDYEAQRHWMELTLWVPLGEWYTYDLQYWGLDYPPLTAYVSYAFGRAAAAIEPAMVALGSSRGHESEVSKVVMRGTVIVADLVVLFPALAWFSLAYYRGRGTERQGRRRRSWAATMLAAISAATQPALVLVDHGHFQYNGVSLGLTAAAVAAVHVEWIHAGAALFALSLNFKQMSLYHALPFFFHLLSVCLSEGPGLKGRLSRVASLGGVVAAVFAALWMPFAVAGARTGRGALAGLRDVLVRLFPFDRGIFEDKVSNLWCVTAPLTRIRSATPGVQALLPLAAALLTLAMCAPSCAALVRRRRPSTQAFLYALAACGLAFFLASFQVHEKSVLLPLLPVSLLVLEEPKKAPFFSALAAFSLTPLLIREGLAAPLVVVTVAFLAALHMALQVVAQEEESPLAWTPVWWRRRRPSSVDSAFGDSFPARLLRELGRDGPLWTWFAARNLAAMAGLTALQLFVEPPAGYPDLFTLFVCAFCCAHLCLAWLYTSAMAFASP